MQNVTISCYCFVNNGKEMKQRIITHAYTAVVLVSIVSKLISLKSNIDGQILNSQVQPVDFSCIFDD